MLCLSDVDYIKTLFLVNIVFILLCNFFRNIRVYINKKNKNKNILILFYIIKYHNILLLKNNLHNLFWFHIYSNLGTFWKNSIH